MRVDGHTDVRPIAGLIQVETGNAVECARDLSSAVIWVSLGVPAQRLVAAGFAEFQPLDTAATEDAYRRNRRIELKLTER